MRGSLWTLLVVGVGSALLFGGAVGEAVPSSPASSTEGVVNIFGTVSPFVGQLLAIAALGFLILAAMDT